MRFKAVHLTVFMTALAGATVAQAAPATDVARGKIQFVKCAACHTVSAKSPAKLGPHLEGIVGRKSLAVSNFNYSPAMKKANVKWDEATLDKWLQRPASVVPGTSMVFAGISNPADRKALIAYLKKPQ